MENTADSADGLPTWILRNHNAVETMKSGMLMK